MYRGDLELANGYVELTDAAEQTRRFESDQETRRSVEAGRARWTLNSLPAYGQDFQNAPVLPLVSTDC